MFPLTRRWAVVFLGLGIINLPFALILALREPAGFGFVNVVVSLGIIAVGIYRVFRPVSPR